MASIHSQALRANSGYFVASAITCSLVLLASRIFGFPIDFALYNLAFFILAPGVAAVAFVCATLVSVARSRPDRLFAFLKDRITTSWELPKRLAFGLPVLLLSPLFFSIFTSAKSAINSIVPFYADPLAAWLDELIHGQAAWKFLHPVLGQPYITFGLNIIYNAWMFVFYTTFILCAFMVTRQNLRSQFLISFILCWGILGGMFAVLLSSVGPCFYAAYYGDDPFRELMAYLNRTNEILPIWSLTAQEVLLRGAQASQVLPGAGISALPSLHVSVAMLIAILAWQVNRRLGWFGIAFFVSIVLGSVHLAWHYAVDAYLSIIVTPIIWKLSGYLVEAPYQARLQAPAAGE